MRTRERTVIDEVSKINRILSGNGSSVTLTGDIRTKVTEEMRDVEVPHFLVRQRRGQTFFNPMFSRRLTVSDIPGNFSGGVDAVSGTAVYNPWWEKDKPRTISFEAPAIVQSGLIFDRSKVEAGAHSVYGLESSMNPDVIGALVQGSINKAYANVDPTDVDLLPVVAELNSTVATIVQILYKLIKIIKAVKRADLRALSKELSASEVADAYLQARYGIRPLIYDLRDAVTVWNQTPRSLRKKRHNRHTARGRRQMAHDDLDFATVSHPVKLFTGREGGPHSTPIYTIRDKVEEYRIKVSRDVEARTAVMYEYTAAWNPVSNSLGLLSVPEAILDLTPMSFIFGWFVDVASAVSAARPRTGVRILGATTTVRSTTTKLRTYSCSTPDSNNRSEARNDYSTGKQVARYFNVNAIGTRYESCSQIESDATVTRTVGSTAGLPQVDVNLDVAKIIDMIAIIRGLLSSSSRPKPPNSGR